MTVEKMMITNFVRKFMLSPHSVCDRLAEVREGIEHIAKEEKELAR